MAKSPSLIALLGLLAVAGYSNRDKIGSWLDGMRAGSGSAGRRRSAQLPAPTRAPPGPAAASSTISATASVACSAAARPGRRAASAAPLSDLVDSFTGKGRGDVAQLVDRDRAEPRGQPGGGRGCDRRRHVDELVAKTGLSRGELLDRLSSVLPAAVDGLTPDGRLPSTGADPRFARA